MRSWKPCLLLLLGMLAGQCLSAQVGLQLPVETVKEKPPSSVGEFFRNAQLFSTTTKEVTNNDPRHLLSRTAAIPSAYCYDDLAFFCRIEVQLEKAAQIPVRFRLGDVRYVDWLEGKSSVEIK